MRKKSTPIITNKDSSSSNNNNTNCKDTSNNSNKNSNNNNSNNNKSSSSSTSQKSNIAKADINIEITYKKNKQIFFKLITNITQHLINFWDLISRETINFPSLKYSIHEINSDLESLFSIWMRFSRFKTIDNKLLLIYEKFLKNVLNDEYGAEELLNKYLDNQQNGTSMSSSPSSSSNFIAESTEENFLGEYETYIQDGSGYLLASGSSESFEKILSFNPSLARIFNYTVDELKHKNINNLLPPLLRYEHNKRLAYFATNEDSKDKSSNTFGKVTCVGLKKTGYIFPLNLTVTIIPGITTNSLNFLALIKQPPSDSAKPYPIYFLTDTNLDIRNVSSQAIQVFGINSNNICYKNSNGDNEYINISLLIKELMNLKDDKRIIDNYKSGYGLSQKKKVVISDISDLKETLAQSAERNKAVNVVEQTMALKKVYKSKLMNNNKKQDNNNNNNNNDNGVNTSGITIESNISVNLQPKFAKEYYISLYPVKICDKTLGYVIKLEPLQEENFLIDTKNIIAYESNVLIFNPNTYSFINQNDIDNTANMFPLASMDNNNNNVSYNKRKGKFKTNTNKLNINNNNNNNNNQNTTPHQLNQAMFINNNLVNYLYKINNVHNYADIQKVKTIIRVQGRPDTEIPIQHHMKVDDNIKKIDNIIKISSLKEMYTLFTEEDENEEGKNEESLLLQRTTENLLNFKGIEGWSSIYNKIRKSKIPKKIIFMRVFIIVMTLCRIVLMFLSFLYQHTKLNTLQELNSISNYTLQQSHYVIDSITQSEITMNCLNNITITNTNTSTCSYAKDTVISNTNQIILLTNYLRQIGHIDNEEYLFYKNRSFVLLETPGVGSTVQMNILEVSIQLINKLLGFAHSEERRSINESFNLFLQNANNVYAHSVLDITDNLLSLWKQKLNNFNINLRMYLYISCCLILICIVNVIQGIKINQTKNSILNLFYTIPEKICWKYHSNCEWFMKYMNNYDTNHNKSNQVDYDKSAYNEALNSSRRNISNKSKDKQKGKSGLYSNRNNNNNSNTINKDNDDDTNTFFKSKRLLSTFNFDNNKVGTVTLLKLIFVNMSLFLIDISYFGFAFLNFHLQIKRLRKLNDFSHHLFHLRTSMNLYSINQRQLVQQTNITLLYQDNVQFQNDYYEKTTSIFDSLTNDWYSQGIDLFKDIKSITTGKDYDIDVFSIINEGKCITCQDDESSKYYNVCSTVIPEKYYGIHLLSKSLFDNFTQMFIASDMFEQFDTVFQEPRYYNHIRMLREYLNPIINDILFYTSMCTEEILQNIHKVYIVMICIYLIFSIGSFLLYWFFIQNRDVNDIIQAKTTLLLINSKDLRDIRYIMDFLQKEVYKINTHT